MTRFENIRNTFTAAAFIGLLVLPYPLYFLFKSYFPNTNTENRPLAEMPTLSKDSLETFFDDFSTYYNDHLPFRTAMKSLYSNANYYIFGDTTDSVLAGKDGWLFYRNKNDASPVHQVQVKKYFSEDEMEIFSTSIKENFAYANKKNIDLYYLILPNKENVYREYLPDSVTIYNQETASERLIKYLDDEKIIYPKAELLAAKEQSQIYFKLDSHWNSLGAFIGYRTLNAHMTNPLDTDDRYLELKPEYHSTGDLAKMSGLDMAPDYFPTITYKGISFRLQDESPKIPSANLSEEIEDFSPFFICNNPQAESDKTIMFIGDSFRTAISQYFCADYRKAIIMHRSKYDESLLDEYHPDIVVIEYVERYFNITLPLHTS